MPELAAICSSPDADGKPVRAWTDSDVPHVRADGVGWLVPAVVVLIGGQPVLVGGVEFLLQVQL